MTPAQRRMMDLAVQYGADDDGAPYWDVINDWCGSMPSSLVLRNADRTFGVLRRTGRLRLDEDGLIWTVTPKP